MEGRPPSDWAAFEVILTLNWYINQLRIDHLVYIGCYSPLKCLFLINVAQQLSFNFFIS